MANGISDELLQSIAEDLNGSAAKPADTGTTQPEAAKAITAATEAAATTETTEPSNVTVTEEATAQENTTNTSKEVSDEDILKYVNEKTGSKYASIDDLKSASSAVKESKNLQKKIAELEAIVPTDESAKNLVKFLRDGGTAEKFIKLQELDVKKMSDRDKMVQLHVLKNGLAKDEAENLVDETYRLSEDEDDTDRTVKAARTRLKIDAKGEAEQFINKWRQEAVVPQTELKATQLAAKWEDSIPKAIDTISATTSFSFENQKYVYNLTKEQKDEMAQLVKESVTNIPEDIDPNTPEGIKYVNEMANFLFAGKHWKSMVHAYIESYKASEIKRKANVTVGLPAQNAEAGNVDAEDGMLQGLKQRYGRA